MSRQNKRREIYAEDNLAIRIAIERSARHWSNDDLAKRMSEAGCPMTGSAIFKIEKAIPRRRIVVDELIAFAKVFGLSVNELLLPVQLAMNKESARLAQDWAGAINVARNAIYDQESCKERWQEYVTLHFGSAMNLAKYGELIIDIQVAIERNAV